MYIYEIPFDESVKATLVKGDQIGILAWKIPDRELSEGEYSAFSVALPEAQFLKTVITDLSVKNKWIQVQDRSWDVSPVDADTISVLMFAPSKDDAKDWKFIVGIKTPEEPGTEKLELDIVVDKSYCMGWDTNIFGKKCPIDPETKKEMDLCLNWRRTDPLGEKCRVLLSEKEKTDSALSFCGTNSDAADCKCVNRELDPEYLKEKPKHTDHDYCWYAPCSSDYYLRKPEQVDCITNIGSQTNFDVQGTGGNVYFDDIDKKKSPTENNSSVYIVMAIIGIVALFFFFKKP